MALIRAAEPAASASEPKVSASMADSVRCRRRSRPQRSVVNPLCSATPRATFGWAICSRMARPQPARSTRSRWILQAMPPPTAVSAEIDPRMRVLCA